MPPLARKQGMQEWGWLTAEETDQKHFRGCAGGSSSRGWKVNGIAKDSDVRTHSVGGSGGFGSGRRGSELGQSPDFQNRLRPSQ